jgi:hypothetical protein
VLCARAPGLAVFAVFCSDLSAADISLSAESLAVDGFGALKNSEILWLFFAVIKVRNSRSKVSSATNPSPQFKGTP